MRRASSMIASLTLTVIGLAVVAVAGWHVKANSTRTQAGAQTKPVLVAQLGHSNNVTSIALSGDGKYLVTGSSDKTAKLWDVESGKEIRTFTKYSNEVHSVALSEDAKYIVMVEDDPELWDVQSGKEIRSFPGHSMQVNSVALSADNKYLVTGSDDNTAKLWDVASGKEIRTFSGHSEWISSVSLSKDAKYLVTGSGDNTAKLWEVESGKEIRIFSGHSGSVWSVALSGDARYLVTAGDDNAAKLWDVESGREIRTFSTRTHPRSVALSRDARYVVTSEADSATLWEVESGKEIHTFSGHLLRATSVVFSPDGKYVVTGSYYDTATMWDVASGEEIRSFTGDSEAVVSVDLSRDGKYLVTGSRDNTANLWDIESGREIRTFPGRSAGLSADAQYLVTVSDDGTTKMRDVEDGKEVRRFSGSFLALSEDIKYLVTASDNNTAKLWDVVKGTETRSFSGHAAPVENAILSTDGKFLITAGTDKAKLWNVKSGKEIRTFSAQSAGMARVELIATVGTQGATPGGHYDYVTSIALSGDAKYLVTGSRDGTARLFEVTSGREIRTFSGHPSGISTVALTKDGKYLVTGGTDSLAKLWEVESGREIRTFSGHTGMVDSVALSSDGKYLVTGSRDGTTRIWNLQDGNEFCRLISFYDGNWAVVDAAGHFDVSNVEEIEGLDWVMPDEPMKTYPIEIFMRDYYEPRLLPRILKGEKFKEIRNLSDLNRVQPPVKITGIERQGQSDSVTVTVEVAKSRSERQRNQEGDLRETGVYDLRLFRHGQIVGEYTNGKPRASGTDNELLSWRSEMQVKLDVSGKRTIKFENIKLPREADVKQIEFSAYAFNEDRVKGQTDRKTFDIPADLKPHKGRAYIISVGVNAYENPAFDLRYSVNDARAIQQTMFDRLSKADNYDQVVQVPLISDYEVHRADKIIPSHEAAKEDLAAGEKVLTSNSATKSNLKAVIDVLAGKQKSADLPDSIPNAADLRKQLQQAQPEDLVLISFSSHGYVNASGHFYFVLSDTGPGTDEQISETLLQRLSTRFLSSVELSLWLRDVDAGEMMMIVDACHSAAAVQGQAFKPGPMGSRGFGQLSYDKGMRILTSTQATDVSYGIGALKQGLLTYVLVKDGIEAGKADFKPVDRQITVSEWLEYGEQGVPKFLEEASRQAKSQNARVEIKELVQKIGPDLKTQRPSLFDFARKRTDVVLVRQ